MNEEKPNGAAAATEVNPEEVQILRQQAAEFRDLALRTACVLHRCRDSTYCYANRKQRIRGGTCGLAFARRGERDPCYSLPPRRTRAMPEAPRAA